MWPWIMRVLFKKVPTCETCGHQMPEGGYIHMAFGGTGVDDVLEWETCRKCGGGSLRYAKQCPHLRLVK